jgi:malonyl-CoA/methylmalonyl-CoA synthetase
MAVTAPGFDWTADLPSNLAAGSSLVADGSLPGRWVRRWHERGSEPQLRAPDGSWLSAEELEERTRLGAEGLLNAGLHPGDRFVICAAASVELVVAYIAAVRAGLVVLPLNTAYTQAEIERIVRDAEPAAAVVDDAQRGRLITEAAGGELRLLEMDLKNLPQGSIPIDAAGLDDPALLVYTSGTTGRPKGALLTQGNLLASATAVNLAWRWTPEDRLLLTLPLFHLHGLGVGLNGSLCAGAEIILRTRFDPGDVAQMAEHGTTMFFGVPAMYQRLLEGGRLASLRRLRLLVSGSAPLPAALAHEIADATGQVPLERYGMTETVMLTSNPYDGPRKPGTVGFPLPGVQLRLAPEGGEVEVVGPNVISGYCRNPEANAEAFTDDGWFRTGDLGEFDEDGYLRLIGRCKELIITGGYNVYPREVEEAIHSHPAVVEVAVVGRPSDRWGEEVTAVVVAGGEVGPEDLRAHASQQLAPYKVPKRVEFVEALPRNALGKVIRSDL